MGTRSYFNNVVFALPLALSDVVLRALGASPRQRRPQPGRRDRPQTATTGAGASSRRAARARTGGVVDVAAMRRELGAVLDAHEGSRSVFRYLAHFERRLAEKGLPALEQLSVKRLRRALAQLEAIVTNWSSPCLADLRSRMAVGVASRDSASKLWQPPATLSRNYAPRPMPMLASPSGSAPAAPGGGASEVEDHDFTMSQFEAAVGEWQLDHRKAVENASREGATRP